MLSFLKRKEIHHGSCLMCDHKGRHAFCQNCYCKTLNPNHVDKCSEHLGKNVYWIGSNSFTDTVIDGVPIQESSLSPLITKENQ